MKINKKVIESAAVAVLALTMMVTAAIAGNAGTNAEQYTRGDITEETEVKTATKEKAEVDIVAAAEIQGEEAAEEAQNEEESAEAAGTQNEEESVEAAEAQNEEENVEAAEAQEEESAEAAGTEEPAVEEPSEWANKLMANVEETLNIRAEASEEAELVGKLHKGAAADIIERGEEWTRISSGSVEGYVKNEYCVFDAEAEALANELGTVYATALVSGLRVRAEANTAEETRMLDVLEEGEKIKVDTETEAPEGWVAVICFDTTAYVSAEFVSVELELGKAISIEEELAAIKKAEEEARAAKAAKAQKSSSGTVQKEAMAASYDDVTLLGALIQCEAGGESYEGQLAVGAVVMNRLRSGYAGSVSGVIYQSGQFGPASSGALASRLANGVSGSCLQAAQEALNGADNVSGATCFKRASSGQAGIVIGNHVFY